MRQLQNLGIASLFAAVPMLIGGTTPNIAYAIGQFVGSVLVSWVGVTGARWFIDKCRGARGTSWASAMIGLTLAMLVLGLFSFGMIGSFQRASESPQAQIADALRGEIEERTSPRVAAFAAEGMKPTVESPEMIAWARSLPPGTDANAAGAVASARGIVRLDPPRWLEVMALREKLSDASFEVCVGLWTGGLPQETLLATLDVLSDHDLRTWFSLNADAMAREIPASAAVEPPSEKRSQEAWVNLMDVMPEEEKRAFVATVTSTSPPSAEDACAAMHSLHRHFPELQVDDQRVLVHGLFNGT